MRRFYVFNAGCIRRGLDTILVKKYLESNGWKITSSPRYADLIVIATCGVVKANEINSLKAIEKAVRTKGPDATVVISGCLPKIHPEEIRKLGDFKFVPSGELQKLDQIVNPSIPLRDIETPDSVREGSPIIDYLIARSFCRKSRLYKKLFAKFGMNNRFLRGSVMVSRAIGAAKIVPYYNIKIADGCLSACSFCATRFATGRLRSRPTEEIFEEFMRGLRQGYRFFQLVSEDTGCYGLDIGSSLPNLLEKLLCVEGNYQLIIIDYNPYWLTKQHEELLPILTKYQDKIKELFVSVQSGSDRILRRMRRGYTADEVKTILREINEKAPKIALRTTVLVGFPGETEEDFEATKQLVRDIAFAEVTINRYEDRPNTASARMDNKVDQETIECRAHLLVEELNCRLLS